SKPVLIRSRLLIAYLLASSSSIRCSAASLIPRSISASECDLVVYLPSSVRLVCWASCAEVSGLFMPSKCPVTSLAAVHAPCSGCRASGWYFSTGRYLRHHAACGTFQTTSDDRRGTSAQRTCRFAYSLQ